MSGVEDTGKSLHDGRWGMCGAHDKAAQARSDAADNARRQAGRRPIITEARTFPVGHFDALRTALRAIEREIDALDPPMPERLSAIRRAHGLDS